ncbi:MAG: tetratricopeptide repeat protein [Desulfovibrio sp.]|nr:tetratricopeptide repeat protein [Desulfovibrio sp.]
MFERVGIVDNHVRMLLSLRTVGHAVHRTAQDRLDIEFFAAGFGASVQSGPENNSRQVAHADAKADKPNAYSAGFDASPADIGSDKPVSAWSGLASFTPADSLSNVLRQKLGAESSLSFLQLVSLGGGDAANESFPSGSEKPARGFWDFWGLSEALAAQRPSQPAHSALPAPTATQNLGDRGGMVDRQTVLGRVNTGGPEDWPENKALSTVTESKPGAATGDTAQSTGTPDASSSQSSNKVTQQIGGTVGSSATGTVNSSATGTVGSSATGTVAPVGSSDGASPASPNPAQSSENAVQPSAASGQQLNNGQTSTGGSVKAQVTAPASQPAPAPAQSILHPAENTAQPGSREPAKAAQSGSVSGKVSGQTVGLPSGQQPPEEAAKKPEDRPVLYVDEQGNPVDKPIKPEVVMEEAERLLREQKYVEALPQLEKLKNLPGVSPELLEKALYYISDCMWARYADNPLAGYEAIISATSEAMNANLRSSRVPEALLRLGLANVNVGNLVDAGGYIVALLRRYPDYPGVAQGFTSLGKVQLKRGLNERAEQSFSIVLDKYPESSYLQEASVGLAEALSNQKKFENAQLILDFISKRWPRYYIDKPAFLLLQADNDKALGKIVTALSLYWLYYNLVPAQSGNDALLLELGDMYARQGVWPTAEFVYRYVERQYAGSSPGFVAQLRLAEKGIYDSPITYNKMSSVFARADGGSLWKVYTDLAATSNTAPEAVLARLKEAMWLYWDKKYTEAMGKAADFIDAYPDNANVPEARDLIWEAFQKELTNSLAERNYGRILILWNGFPLVRERYGAPDPRMRYVLAQGLLERGDDAAALAMLADFLKSPMDPNYGEAAFTEFFNRYLKAGAWDKVLDLGRLVSTWPMNKQLRNQLDYALALSAQNLNLSGPALAMWAQLVDRQDIPLYQRAYAAYFLAQDAEKRKDIKNAYELNRKVLELFTLLQDERSDKADPQRIKDALAALMDISEVANRVPEALEWVERYNAYAPAQSPEYPGLRFREARLYRKLGDAARAQALLEDIVHNYPNSPFAQAAAAELRTFEVSRDLQNYLPGGGSAPQAPAGQQPAQNQGTPAPQ